MSNLEQEHRIKLLLAKRLDSRGRRMNITSLAEAIGVAYGTTAGVVYGNRVNPPVRAKIAGFLGVPVEELFGGNGAEAIRTAGEGAQERTAGEGACATQAEMAAAGHGGNLRRLATGAKAILGRILDKTG